MAAAQETETVTVVGTYVGNNVTPVVGYQRAQQRAMNEAIEKVAGVEVFSTKNFQKESSSDDEIVSRYASFMNTFSKATVKDYKVLDRFSTEMKEDGESVFKYTVKLEAEVIKSDEGPDPGFTVQMNINKPAYIEGDELIVTVGVSKTGFVTLFNFTSNNRVYIIYPNAVMEQKVMKSNEKRQIPSDEDRKSGIVFELEVAKGQKSSSEIMLAIATKQRIPLITEMDDNTGFEYVRMKDFQRWLSSIPLNQRAYDSKQYFIYKQN